MSSAQQDRFGVCERVSGWPELATAEPATSPCPPGRQGGGRVDGAGDSTPVPALNDGPQLAGSRRGYPGHACRGRFYQQKRGQVAIARARVDTWSHRRRMPLPAGERVQAHAGKIVIYLPSSALSP